jgi:serine/threonine-protein kinase
MSDPSSSPPAKTCPQCGRVYATTDRFCTVDGASLIASGTSSILGTVVADRFLVLEKLGEGGMGEVYLAEHVRIKRKVALKLMRPWMIGDPVAVNRFHREAENASQISHANVAHVYDFGETSDGMVYLAMEFVPGEPLSEILEREGHLHCVRTAELVRQIAEALVAAHAMGILHRDLKPDNVMVARSRSGTDVVKLVDFGIARAMDRSTQKFTSTGVIVGTPDYMSPEQLSGDTLDGRSDLYALGLIAFRALAGTGAFPEGSSSEALLARLTTNPRRLGAVRSTVSWPESLETAFARVLAADPAARFADPMEFVAELDAAVAVMPLGPAEQEYLVALSQRHTTPVRGGAVVESRTPARGVTPVSVATVGSGEGALPMAAATPPSGSEPIYQAAEGATGPMDAPRLTQHPWSGEITPVPRLETLTDPAIEVPPPAAPAPDQTPASPWWRRGVVAVGVAALAVAALLVARRGPNTPAESAGQPEITTPSTTPQIALTDSAPPLAASGVLTDSQIVAQTQRATFAVWGGERRGSAVLIDASGLALTSASLVRDSTRIDVFIDPGVRVRGSVVSVDAPSGLAAIMIPMSRCRRCTPIELDTALQARGGDSLLAAPSNGRSDGTVVRTAVASVANGVPTLATAVARLGDGTPFVSTRTGMLVSLGVRRNGTRVGLASLPALRDLRVRAVPRAKTVAVNDTLYPTWPAQSVPTGFLAAEAPRSGANLAAYTSAARDGFALLAMTPPVMHYRQQQLAATDNTVPDDPFKIPTRASTPVARDPIGQWSGWRPTIDERRGVVVLSVGPENATYPNLPARVVDLKGGSLTRLTLFRDGVAVPPIDTALLEAVGNAADYRAQGKAVALMALAVYAPAEFTNPGSEYRVVAQDARGRSVTLPLSRAMLDAIAADFSWLSRR